MPTLLFAGGLCANGQTNSEKERILPSCGGPHRVRGLAKSASNPYVNAGNEKKLRWQPPSNCFGRRIITVVQSTNQADRKAVGDAARTDAGKAEVLLRSPQAEDGPQVSALIAACPPLDVNSSYCNLLQCTDFADTCVIAERGGRVVGWISAYRLPATPERLFVWQVAVDETARGEGLALRMLDALLARPAARGATTLTTTITEANDASWALFGAFARRCGAELTKSARFSREAHFAGAHDTEWEARIAPLPTRN
jgi:L-2,4-diaminobutyric acid acetyltransferase